MSHNRVYVNGRVHVRRRRCDTCIFGPRSPVTAARVHEMIRKAGDDGCIPCHHNLGEPIEPVCRGFYDLRGARLLRMAAAFDVITFMD